MDKAPLLSVILPVYNGEKFLDEALDSVRAQRYPALEIIIVDDGSTDGTGTIVRNRPETIRYIRQNNGGPAAARNRGIREAQAELIAFLDADDIWPDRSLTLRLETLRRDPALRCVIGQVRMIRMNKPVAVASPTLLSEPLSLPMLVGSGLFYRSVFERIGFFDEGLRQSEDLDWLLRLREAGIPMRYLDAVTLHYRQHENGLSKNRAAAQQGIAKALLLSLKRRRRPESGSSSA